MQEKVGKNGEAESPEFCNSRNCPSREIDGRGL